MLCLEMIGYFTDEPDSQDYPFAALKLTLPVHRQLHRGGGKHAAARVAGRSQASHGGSHRPAGVLGGDSGNGARGGFLGPSFLLGVPLSGRHDHRHGLLPEQGVPHGKPTRTTDSITTAWPRSYWVSTRPCASWHNRLSRRSSGHEVFSDAADLNDDPRSPATVAPCVTSRRSRESRFHRRLGNWRHVQGRLHKLSRLTQLPDHARSQTRRRFNQAPGRLIDFRRIILVWHARQCEPIQTDWHPPHVRRDTCAAPVPCTTRGSTPYFVAI